MRRTLPTMAALVERRLREGRCRAADRRAIRRGYGGAAHRRLRRRDVVTIPAPHADNRPFYRGDKLTAEVWPVDPMLQF